MARISQICLNDPGAPLNSIRNIWTTYLKSRLSCVHDATKSSNGAFEEAFKFQASSKLFQFNEISKYFPTNKLLNKQVHVFNHHILLFRINE